MIFFPEILAFISGLLLEHGELYNFSELARAWVVKRKGPH